MTSQPHPRCGARPLLVRALVALTVAASVAVATLVVARPVRAAVRPRSLAATTTTAPSAADRAAQASALPDAPVLDLRSGRNVALRSVADGRPIVLWFWAPG